jgi:hypothetical protein
MMRAFTKLCLAIGLALSVSASAGATVSIGLVQAGGTYSASVGASAGDTLVLSITYSLQPGDAVTLLDPGVVWDGAVASFDAENSTRTPDEYWGPNPIPLDIIDPEGPRQIAPNRATGWAKGTTTPGGMTTPCVFGSCTSLGTAAFVLSGSSGVVAIGAVGLPGGTVIGDGTFVDIAGISFLGTFTIVPQPATASLLGLGLLGLAAARRFRRG